MKAATWAATWAAWAATWAATWAARLDLGTNYLQEHTNEDKLRFPNTDKFHIKPSHRDYLAHCFRNL